MMNRRTISSCVHETIGYQLRLRDATETTCLIQNPDIKGSSLCVVLGQLQDNSVKKIKMNELRGEDDEGLQLEGQQDCGCLEAPVDVVVD
eukprot:15683980-Heterocapsa_arctica.AAC.1